MDEPTGSAGPEAVRMSRPTFGGRRVLTFESRRADEIARLIETFGGRPITAPAVREAANESDEAAIAFAHAMLTGEYDAVVFLTGAGVRALVGAVDRAGLRPAFLQALRRVRLITRGPKPVAALRELDVPVWANAPEPHTWQTLLQAIDERADWSIAGRRIAVQEYGVPNVDLLDALRSRRAIVTAVRAYRWILPDDLEPLREAARAVAAGAVDVVLVTSGVQVVHFWQVVRELGLETGVRRGLDAATIASIGPAASAELRRHGIEPAFEPDHPKMGLLVRTAAERAGGS
jgi:uroporphyrinogen-III synthase